MNPNALYAALPDLSARIMRNTVVNELNTNWDSFCRSNSIKPMCLDDGTTELLAQEELLLQQGFVLLTASQPNLWVDVGLRYRSIKYGSLGLAMMTAGTLGGALEIACRYQSLTYSLIGYRFVSAPNGSCALIGDHAGVPDHLYNFTQHRDLGAIRTLIADVMGGEQVLEKITVAANPPCNWEDIRSNFACPVEFNADRTQWLFQPGTANKPLPLADQDLVMLYSSRCDELMGRAHAGTPVTQRLLLLLGTNGNEPLSASEAARRMAVSERTLHRRLAEEGTRFSAMVDDARHQRACELLADRRMTIEAISFAVGFAEPSSFSRAFKRWSGMGALEYRRQRLGHKTPF